MKMKKSHIIPLTYLSPKCDWLGNMISFVHICLQWAAEKGENKLLEMVNVEIMMIKCEELCEKQPQLY